MIYYTIYIILFLLGFTICLFPQTYPEKSNLRITAFIIVSTAMVIFLWKFTIPGAYYVDFTKAYYPAGQIILSNPESLYQGKLPEFVNIPIVAFLFYPLSQMTINYAIISWVFVSFFTVAICCYWVIRIGHFKGYDCLLVVWLFITSGPLFYSIRLGNTTHFLLLLICAIIAWRDQKPFIAGSLTAFCAFIKLPLILLGFYYVFRKRWSMAIGFWLTTLVIISCSYLIFGTDLHNKWYTEAIGRYSDKVIGAYNNQSINGFLAHLRPNNHLYSWLESSYGWKFNVARHFLIMFFVVLTGWILWQPKAQSNRDEFNLEFFAIICLSILISPISWIHYYVLLLVPTAFFVLEKDREYLNTLKPRINIKSKILILVIAFNALPVFHTLSNIGVSGNHFYEYLFKHIFISHYFFGGTLFLWFCLLKKREASTVFAKVES